MTFDNLKRWTRPDSYIGKIWPDYYSSGVGQSRDSSSLERANFDAMLKRLGGESETVIVVRESHWAVGWVEWIAIHNTDDKSLSIADGIMKALDGYPVIDENLWSRYEDDECSTVWSDCFDVHDRIDYFRRHSYTCTSVSDMLQAVRGGSWHHAANMLHCPSDLIA